MRKPEKPDQVKFYLDLTVRSCRDQAALCNLGPSSIERDIVTIQSRTQLEGLSFLTKTLPSLGKCFDKALSSDIQFPTGHSFDISKKLPGCPVIFTGFWKLIFDASGKVAETLTEAETLRQCAAVRAIRQICYLFYKLEGVCTAEQEQRVIENFVSTDRLLPEEEEEIPLSLSTRIALDRARMLICYALKDFDPLDISPGHGPGAVATGEKPWNKMSFKRFYVKLDEMYPYTDYFFYNLTHLCDELDVLMAMEELHESTAKVVLVPKDSRGPRLISMEPLEIQWVQQGLLKGFVREIERPSNVTGGYVNFTYQDINQDLALRNSMRGDFITADLKDASDRVSMWLVRKLFPEHVFNCLKASRSQLTKLPNGHILRLKKFAPMGSSVCFPVEALIFWALAVGSVSHISTVRDMYRCAEVYVYGDDLVYERSHHERIVSVFEECFLAFNKDKCCTGGFFRESCGVDAFKKENVTPIRIKARWNDPLSPAAVLAYVSYVNASRARGMHTTADFLQQELARIFGEVPITNRNTEMLFCIKRSDWTSQEVEKYLFTTFKHRYNRRYQRWEILIRKPSARVIQRGAPDWSELLRLRPKGSSHDPFGFESSGQLGPCRHSVPHRIVVRRGWVAAELLLA